MGNAKPAYLYFWVTLKRTFLKVLQHIHDVNDIVALTFVLSCYLITNFEFVNNL